ncbi:MAG TPA: hypothetical protein VJ436_05775 [Anaerolineales bacterium]|nr:hypothetical protein [Anaerolineales bacterium]
MNVLAIGAYPENLEVLCRGRLARYAQAGGRVIMYEVTDGRFHPIWDAQAISQIRREKAWVATDLFESGLRWLGLLDGPSSVDQPAKVALCGDRQSRSGYCPRLLLLCN